MNVIFILALYVIIVNIVGFAEMGIDKRRARKGAYRIPEANLFLTAIIGGVSAVSSACMLFDIKPDTEASFSECPPF